MGEQLVIAYNQQIDKYFKRVRKAERAFSECLNKINKLFEDNIVVLREQIKKMDHEMWNTELCPFNMIFDISVTKETLFIDKIMDNKAKIIEWIDKNMNKYEDIAVYGK